MMSGFAAFYLLEFKRFLTKGNLVAWGIVLALVLFAMNAGIQDYDTLTKKVDKFSQIQEKHFMTIPNYHVYSRDGVRCLFTPSPAVILFSNTTLPGDVTARVDSVMTQQINNNLKGKSLGGGAGFGALDVSRMVMLLITLLSMWYGYQSLQDRGYLLCLCSSRSPLSVFLGVPGSRLLLFSQAFTLVNICLLGFLVARGVAFTLSDYTGFACYFLAALQMLVIFFLIGVLMGTLRSSLASITGMFGIWFLMIFVIPGVLSMITVSGFPDITRDYQTELDKFKIITSFEDRARDKYGKFNRENIEAERKMVENYWATDIPRIVAREEKLKSELERNILLVNRLAVLTPATFYLLTGNEVSSRGYGNFLNFYDYVNRMWHKFARFYIDRTFYNDPGEMVNFIRGDENVFHGRSGLPVYFSAGIVINLFYIGALGLLGYVGFMRCLFPVVRDKGAYINLWLDFEATKLYTVDVSREDFIHQFTSSFYGRSNVFLYEAVIEDGDELTTVQNQRDFFYIPTPGTIPGELKVRDLFLLFTRLFKFSRAERKEALKKVSSDIARQHFKELDLMDKARVLLILAKLRQASVYVLKDFAIGISGDLAQELCGLVESLREKPRDKDCMIIDIETTNHHWLPADSVSIISFKDGRYKDINERQ